MFNKDKVIYLIFLIAIAATSLYAVFKNLPIVIGSFRFFWGPFVLITILFIKPAVYLKKPVIIVLIYGIFMLGVLQYSLWQYMPDWTRLGLLEDFYNLLIFSAMFTYLYLNQKYIIWARIGKMAFFFILITIIGTNIALNIDPLIVRNSASVLDPYQNSLAKLTGAAGYGYAQAFVLIIPILVYHIKFRKQFIFKRWILIIILIAIFITLVRAQVFANILAAIAIFMLAFFGAKRARKSFLPISLITIVLIAIPSSIYADMLYSLGSYFDPSSVIHYKLTDFAMFIQNPEMTGTTGAGGRAERYPMLFEALLARPIFGDASYSSVYDIGAGGHLYWMNKLAQWGILGFLFFIFILYQLYKKIRSLFDDGFGFYYFLSVSAFILMGLMKNIAGREPFLMLIIIIPGLYFLPLLENKRPTKFFR
ncbi:MAG: hypothetical protein ACOCWG_05610 [bacterium]